MDNSVLFRDFEERDIDFIYKCKNDEKLNRMIVGEYHPFSYKEAVDWVHGCMGEHETYKFWAICTNDETKRIIGWMGVSQIDYHNQNACFHGIVIADNEYRDGKAWIESFLFVMDFVFVKLKFHRLYGTALSENVPSIIIGEAMFEKTEGIFRDAVFKNDRFYDLVFMGILYDEYIEHKSKGEYEFLSIIRRIGKIRKRNNHK